MRWLPKFYATHTNVPTAACDNAEGWVVQIEWFDVVLEFTLAFVVRP